MILRRAGYPHLHQRNISLEWFPKTVEIPRQKSGGHNCKCPPDCVIFSQIGKRIIHLYPIQRQRDQNTGALTEQAEVIGFFPHHGDECREESCGQYHTEKCDDTAKDVILLRGD